MVVLGSNLGGIGWPLRWLCACSILLPGCYSQATFAKCLGTLGEVFPIAETHLLAQFQANAATFSFADFNQLALDAADRPTPVSGLSTTQQPQVYYFDPSIPAAQLAERHNALTVSSIINPLDTVSLSQPLLFYDADDAKQVTWAQQTDKVHQGNTKLILVSGSAHSQTALFGKPVYFDQGGILTDHFQLHHIPAIITQQDKKLKIEEVGLHATS